MNDQKQVLSEEPPVSPPLNSQEEEQEPKEDKKFDGAVDFLDLIMMINDMGQVVGKTETLSAQAVVENLRQLTETIDLALTRKHNRVLRSFKSGNHGYFDWFCRAYELRPTVKRLTREMIEKTEKPKQTQLQDQ